MASIGRMKKKLSGFSPGATANCFSISSPKTPFIHTPTSFNMRSMQERGPQITKPFFHIGYSPPTHLELEWRNAGYLSIFLCSPFCLLFIHQPYKRCRDPLFKHAREKQYKEILQWGPPLSNTALFIHKFLSSLRSGKKLETPYKELVSIC